MELQVYNSLTKSKVPFRVEGKVIRWYTCGPTVYDHSHMGHARNYVGFDIVRRILEEHFGYIVFQVMNSTDIDDKIINRAKEENVFFTEVTQKWEKAFLEDMQSLGVKPPSALTRVTEFIPEIIDYIANLIKKGMAYEANGSVYFDVKAYSEKHKYGKFVEPNESEEKHPDKRSQSDFALWKTSNSGAVWDSPWGMGRPGWHIECSVMATAILGEKLDIHSGGIDLIYPHHENEIAQCEAAFADSKQNWVNYFLHSGHLHIQGAKMSKSLKNFITIKDALKKYTARQLRMLFVLHPYDKALEYSSDSMDYAISIDRIMETFLENLKMTLKTLKESKWDYNAHHLNNCFISLQEEVDEALRDNFDTKTVVLTLRDFIDHVNSYLEEEPKLYLIQVILDYYQKILSMFGLKYSEAPSPERFDEAVDVLVKYRSAIRNVAKEILSLSDQVRDKDLTEIGVKLIDKGKESHWTS